jgi:tubulin epsilon
MNIYIHIPHTPAGSLFDETQFVMDVYGAGNNFAHGFGEYGPQYR